MSTKATIAYGSNFHFYHEVFDDDRVYLELEGVQFEAQRNRVMVPIPVHIWEVIRTYPGIDLSFADKTDEEVRQYVEREVDERITEYQQAEENAKPLISLFGGLAYGTADTPREQQIEQGVAYFTELRDHRRQVKAAIEELQRKNARR
jgi:hypothetical protein